MTDKPTLKQMIEFVKWLTMVEDNGDRVHYFYPILETLRGLEFEEGDESIGDWQCRDYGDGWITFPTRKVAEQYQEQTGALMRYVRRYAARTAEPPANAAPHVMDEDNGGTAYPSPSAAGSPTPIADEMNTRWTNEWREKIYSDNEAATLSARHTDEAMKKFRQLETELAAAKAKLERYTRIQCEAGITLGDALDEYEKRVEAEQSLAALQAERARAADGLPPEPRLFDCGYDGMEESNSGMWVADDDYCALRQHCADLIANNKAWKDAVIDQLIVAHIYKKEHDADPRKAVSDLLDWTATVALDPSVSKGAADLLAKSKPSGVTVPVEPTIEQCFAAGKGPEQSDTFREGGLPNTPEERARFEAYMRGHCWDIGGYDESIQGYDTTLVRMLYGVWRDRGLLAAAKEGK
jgi:hypothetical protein